MTGSGGSSSTQHKQQRSQQQAPALPGRMSQWEAWRRRRPEAGRCPLLLLPLQPRRRHCRLRRMQPGRHHYTQERLCNLQLRSVLIGLRHWAGQGPGNRRQAAGAALLHSAPLLPLPSAPRKAAGMRRRWILPVALLGSESVTKTRAGTCIGGKIAITTVAWAAVEHHEPATASSRQRQRQAVAAMPLRARLEGCQAAAQELLDGGLHALPPGLTILAQHHRRCHGLAVVGVCQQREEGRSAARWRQYSTRITGDGQGCCRDICAGETRCKPAQAGRKSRWTQWRWGCSCIPGMPNDTASDTSGQASIAPSTSMGLIFSPPRLMSSLILPGTEGSSTIHYPDSKDGVSQARNHPGCGAPPRCSLSLFVCNSPPCQRQVALLIHAPLVSSVEITPCSREHAA